MLLPQFPGMTVDLAYARQVLHRSGAVGRCTEDESGPVARRPWPLRRSTRRAPLIDNASAQCLETTYVRAGEPGMVHGSACGRPGPDGNVPTGGDVTTPFVTGTNAASPPHRNIRTTRRLRLGATRNIRRFSVAVVGRPLTGLEGRLQPIAALRRTRATRGSGPLAAWRSKKNPCDLRGGRGGCSWTSRGAGI
jgi:hypothetical protein